METIGKILEFIDKHLLIIFIVPAIILSFLVMIYPMCYTGYLSLFQSILIKGMHFEFIGLKNYVKLLTDKLFLGSLLNTFYFLALSIPLHLFIGTALALLLGKKFKGDYLVRGIFILPTVTTPVAAALIWGTMFNPTIGVFNYLLNLVGLPSSLWASHPSTVIPSLVLVDSWATIPLTTLIIMGGLQIIPSELIEAARIDGASPFKVFRYIMLPLLRPIIIVAIIFQTIQILRIFDPVWVITQGGPRYSSMTLNLLAFREAFLFTHIGKSAVILMILFFIIIVFCGVLSKFRRAVTIEE